METEGKKNRRNKENKSQAVNDANITKYNLECNCMGQDMNVDYYLWNS